LDQFAHADEEAFGDATSAQIETAFQSMKYAPEQSFGRGLPSEFIGSERRIVGVQELQAPIMPPR